MPATKCVMRPSVCPRSRGRSSLSARAGSPGSSTGRGGTRPASRARAARRSSSTSAGPRAATAVGQTTTSAPYPRRSATFSSLILSLMTKMQLVAALRGDDREPRAGVARGRLDDRAARLAASPRARPRRSSRSRRGPSRCHRGSRSRPWRAASPRTPSASERRFNRTSGVLPTRSRIEAAYVHHAADATRVTRATLPAGRGIRGADRVAVDGRRVRRLRPEPSFHAAATSSAAAACSTAAACTHAPVATCSVASGTVTGAAGEVGEHLPVRGASGRRRRRARCDRRCRPRRRRARRGRRADRTRRLRTRPARAARGSTSGTQPGDRPRRVGPVRRALTVEVGHDDDAARARGAVERQRVETRRGRRRGAARPRRSPWSRSACTRAAGSARSRPRNPATAPDASAVGVSLTANTVPDVPIEIATSPGARPTPSAAAMLSPVPGRDDRVDRTRTGDLASAIADPRQTRAPSRASPSTIASRSER